MKIESLTAAHVRIPLETPYRIARGTMNAFDSVIVRVQTADENVGYGECIPRSVVGDAAHIAAVLNGPIASMVVGRDTFDVEQLVRDAVELAKGQLDCIAGLDVAIWDLVGKSLGEPVYRLLGGMCQPLIEVDYTIGSVEPDSMSKAAASACANGHAGVVVKADCQSVETDAARVRAVRASVPRDRSVRIDCNGGYARQDARAFIEAIADLDIEFVEQPVDAADLEGMRQCRSYGVRISADESVVSPSDVMAAARAEACDVVNIKVPKVGGLLMAKRCAAIAEAAGLPVVVGGRPTLELSRYASRHFAAATPASVGRAHEGPGPASQALSDDVVRTRTTREMVRRLGGVVPESVPGLGAQVEWSKVELYRVPHTPGAGRN